MAKFDDGFLDVNTHGVLRIPLELWLAVLVLARAWIIALLSMASMLGNQMDVMRLIGKEGAWVSLLIELPALTVLWLFVHRTPDASTRVRWLWPHARALLLATALGNLAYMVWFLWQSNYWSPWPELFLVACGLIDLAICWGIHASAHLRQVLQEFPAAKHNVSTKAPPPPPYH